MQTGSRIIVMIGCVTSTLLLVTSCVGNAWMKTSYTRNYSVTIGLWQTCARNICNANPDTIVQRYNLLTLRILTQGAVFASVFATVLTMTFFYERNIRYVVAICLLVAALTELATVIIFIQTRNSFAIDFGTYYGSPILYSWTYIVGWIGTFNCFLFALYGFYASRMI